jgi:hypothetical protein
MIANVNLTKILRFTYIPNKIIEGEIKRVKWRLLEKKQVTDHFFKFVFVYNQRGSSISHTITMTTGDMDVREAAEVCLINWSIPL